MLTNNRTVITKASFVHTVDAPAKCALTLATEDPRFVNHVLVDLMASGNPIIKVRLAIQNESKPDFQDHIITNYSARTFQQGHMVDIETGDVLIRDQRSTRFKVRTGKIGDIVKSIADEIGIGAIIEPTTGSGSETYYQTNLSNTDFIIRRLLPKAINASGRGLYQLFVVDNILHFHTSDYHTRIKQLDFTGQSTSESFEFVDLSQKVIDGGAAGVIGMFHDPYTGQSTISRSDPTKTLNFSDRVNQISNINGANRVIGYHIGMNRVGEATALVQSTYEAGYRKMHRALIKLNKAIQISIGDTLNVIVQHPAQTSPAAGLYNVVDVSRLFLNGQLTTTLVVERGEMRAITRSRQGQKDLAQGVRLNAKTAEKSAVLKGQPSRSADGITRTVQKL